MKYTFFFLIWPVKYISVFNYNILDNIKFAIYSICAFGSTKAVIIPRKKMSYLLKQPGCSTGWFKTYLIIVTLVWVCLTFWWYLVTKIRCFTFLSMFRAFRTFKVIWTLLKRITFIEIYLFGSRAKNFNYSPFFSPLIKILLLF